MATLLNPYLQFDANAAEVLAFYQQVLGGEVHSSTFAEGGISDEPGERDKIMHGMLTTPGGLVLMCADTPPGMEHPGFTSAVSISLSGDDDAQLRGFWAGLADGGTIALPLEVAPWGDAFGLVIDRFGVHWMVNIAGSPGTA
ncbi:PhnB protein [Sediminihabitans luteus]|uniref:PhnB protein n=1 Tax=Sediminihabitans luteus TaxID=1138585 RepID=A0A2M9CEG4_9CELL|nr:VOC family protein [Sediminihabitans luteus]PJJ70252.1 PhnB protein [Sediminihabitans luteus]GII97723.1 VOC family protein [Sediminihabitans luteus]